MTDPEAGDEMRGTLAATAVVAGFLMAMPLVAQTNGVAVQLTGRMQFQFNTTNVSESDLGAGPSTSIAGSTFEIRRVRLAARIDINGWITGMIEPDFALARLQVRQAWMNLAFDPAFELRMGQFKKPFSQILMTSSLETAMIERGLRIRDVQEAYTAADEAAPSPVLGSFRGTTLLGEEQDLLEQFGYMNNDMGVTAHGRLGDVDYDVGLFNGTGGDRRDENDGKSYVGRLRWRAPTEMPLLIGAAASHHEVQVSTSTPVVDGSAFEVDFEMGGFRRQGAHVIAEAVLGDNLGADEQFMAAQGVLSYFRPVTGGRVDGIEPLARLSWGDPDRQLPGDEGFLVTPGINLYFQGRNRLQFNWDVFIPSGDRFDTKYALRAQAQLAF
jgi:Phosphate-selective porin O and P